MRCYNFSLQKEKHKGEKKTQPRKKAPRERQPIAGVRVFLATVRPILRSCLHGERRECRCKTGSRSVSPCTRRRIRVYSLRRLGALFKLKTSFPLLLVRLSIEASTSASRSRCELDRVPTFATQSLHACVIEFKIRVNKLRTSLVKYSSAK